MHDPSRKNQELIDENYALKQRIKELEQSEAERKRAEEALQASDNRLREITTQIPGVVYQYYVMPNGATGFYYISDRSEQVIGLKPDLEGYFERFSAIVIPEHRDSFIKSIEKSVKEASEWKYEGMLQKPSGEIIWFSGNSTPSLREDEIVFNGIVIDISDRKRAEEALQLSEGRFRLLVKNSSDITGIVDPDGKQRYVSDTAERITGFPASELASKNISEVIHPDDLLRVLEAFQGCLAHPDKLLRAEYRHIHKTKGWVYVEAIGQNFIDDPNIRGVIMNVRDITERKKAEDALKLSEITYREIFNTINDSIWVHDIETGKFLDVNNKVTEMFGYSFKEAINLNIEDISSGVPPYTQETAMELFRKATDGEPQIFEWHCKHKDGHLFWTEVTLKRGSIAGKERILAIERDITERKRAEERLEQAHDKLEQRVAERTEELRQANEKLLTDIAERKRMEEALQESEERYKSIVGSVKLGITLIDKNHKIIMTNKYFADLFNKPEAYFVGKYCFMESEKREAICPHCPGTLSMASREPAEVETEGILDDGSRFNALIRTVPTFASDGTVSGFMEVVEDITDRKQADEKIQQMAHHDSLTGLPNRKLFSDRLHIALAQAQRNRKGVGIAMLDLDNFKSVNDTLGHDVGDLLLKATAERLRAMLRKGDTVARFGGDEFLLILPDLKVTEDAIQVAQKIVDSFRNPFLIDTHQLVVTTSIGIAVYPNDGIDEGILLKNADIAMYQAKQAGRDRYQFCKKV